MTGDEAFGRNRRGVMALTAVLVVAAAVAAWLLTRGAPAPEAAPGHVHGAASGGGGEEAAMVSLTPDAARRIGVTYAEVEHHPLEREVRTVASVTYDETRLNAVTVRVDGWIERLFVNFTGQPVRVGDPLFSLYSPMLVSAQQELVLARKLQRDLAGGSPDALAGTEELVASARKRLAYWEVSDSDITAIEQSGEVRKALTIRSPVEGVVIEKRVLQGQRVMAGETAFQVADLRVVWLEGEIFERDLSAVRLGLRVEAEFPSLPGTIRRGTITYVYPTLDPETRTARVRVELPNPALTLKPGMYASFRFSAATPPVLSVPRSAVFMTGKRNLVFVRMPDGSLMAHDVVLGIVTDDRVEVLSGVSHGDTVVASATFLVDAESNLGSQLGGMGNMPGMELSKPVPAPPDTTHSHPPKE